MPVLKTLLSFSVLFVNPKNFCQILSLFRYNFHPLAMRKNTQKSQQKPLHTSMCFPPPSSLGKKYLSGRECK